MDDFQGLYPRHLLPLVEEALAHFPVVVLLGARQVGKSTLALQLIDRGWPGEYRSLDDYGLLDLARRDPDGFVDGLPSPVVLDEIQRAPDLLRAVKRIVDRVRRPGTFVLTGSADLMTMQQVTESLAGRAAIFELLPLSWGELGRETSSSPLIDLLFRCESPRELIGNLLSVETTVGRQDYQARILAGGYPDAVALPTGRLRNQWFSSYRQTYLERDLREVSRVVDLPAFSRLMVLLASRSAELLNITGISRDIGLPTTTVRRHIGLLETTYQTFQLAPHWTNTRKRLVRSPKLYFSDSGLAAHLAATQDWDLVERQGRAGALVETCAAGELRKLLALGVTATDLRFWRTHDGHEVDFLLVRGTRLVGVEVKWTSSPSSRDLRGLRRCREVLGDALGLGVLLYSGAHALAMDEHTVALPFALAFGPHHHGRDRSTRESRSPGPGSP